jgi:hypothetical protein
MDLQQCKNCGESVDAAKAFCPACGDPFVPEDERGNVSEFEADGETVQYGKSAFYELLSEMELNISEAPDKPDTPVVRPVVKSSQANVEHVQPAVGAPTKPEATRKGPRKKWIIAAAIGAVFLFFTGVVVIAAGIIVYLGWYRPS